MNKVGKCIQFDEREREKGERERGEGGRGNAHLVTKMEREKNREREEGGAMYTARERWREKKPERGRER